MTPEGPTSKTLLIVEDNDIARERMATVLRRNGYAVVTAANGSGALNSVHADATPDMILLDMMLPVMDGWRFLDQRKGHPVLATVPLLIITGLGVAGTEWAVALGACGLLRKSIETEPLLAAIHCCLSAR
jgi:CheY-like chemotaxis protein